MCDCFRSILEQKVYIVQRQNNNKQTKNKTKKEREKKKERKEGEKEEEKKRKSRIQKQTNKLSVHSSSYLGEMNFYHFTIALL